MSGVYWMHEFSWQVGIKTYFVLEWKGQNIKEKCIEDLKREHGGSFQHALSCSREYLCCRTSIP